MSDIASPLQKAALVIAAQRARIEALEQQQSGPIAVIGIGCRFPGGADTPEALWHLFASGAQPLRDLPPERQAAMGSGLDRLTVRRGCFLDSIDRFDADFFGISPREARLMDPQQRLLLEVTEETLEQAGLSAAAGRGGKTGVFIGVMTVDYATLAQRPEQIDPYTGTGTSASLLAGRLAHHYDWRGPALTITTACSSSLVAVHQAMVALRRGECDLALAGGANLMLTPEVWQIEAASGMLAPDGCCKPFDQTADGFGRGEGCALVALKRLDQALAEGNPIWGVLLGAAVNHDGQSAGLMVPNPAAQEAVIRAALAEAGLAPEAVGYVEAHGTGTPLGDPIEAEALARAYQSSTRSAPLILGSAKANLGHTEGAAGSLGLLRLILSLHFRRLAPLPLPTSPSARIDWSRLGLRPATAEAYPGPGRPVGGVSSFGFSGTNVHLIAAAAPESAARPVPRPRRIWGGDRYWVPLPPSTTAPSPAAAAPRPGALYGEAWEAVPLAEMPWPDGETLLVHDGAALALTLAETLGARGNRCRQIPSAAAPLPPAEGGVILFPSGPAEDRIALARRWSEAARTADGPCRLSLINAESSPEAGAVTAFLRSAFVEHPALAGRLITAAPATPAARLAAALAQTAEARLCLDADGTARAPRLVPLDGQTSRRFQPRPDRTYLITGGFGTLGRALAGWLVERGARSLLLVGRHIPAETLSLTEAAADPATAAIWADLLRWRARGVTVSWAALDCAEEEALAALVARTVPPIGGVIHAAGLSSQGQSGVAVLRPKIAGSRALVAACAGLDLDLMLFCSSASVWGGAHLADYAAANAFMDHLAAARAEQGLPALSVQFGGWQGSAMLADPILARYQESKGFATLPPARMLELLDPLWGSGVAVGAAVAFEAERYRAVLTPSGQASLLDRLAPLPQTSAAPAARTALLRAHPGRRPALILREASRIAARLLGYDPAATVPPDVPLLDLGFNSLIAVEFRDALAEAFALDLPSTLIYQTPTLRAVADQIAADLRTTEA